MKSKLYKKNILIIGKKGFFARSFKNLLGSHQLTLVSRKQGIKNLNLKKFHFIINCAANIYDEREMFESNTFFVYRMLKQYIDQNSKAKIIHFGTCNEYGPSKHKPSEITPLNPQSIHAGTKAAGSIILSSFSRYFKIPSIILRTYNVYGPFENPSRLISLIFRHLIFKKKLNIYKGYQDYMHIEDLSNIIEKMISSWNKNFFGEIINLGSGTQYSNIQVLKICERVTRIKSDAKIFKHFSKSSHNKKYNYKFKTCDLRKMKKYKFRINTDLQTGIEKYWLNIKKSEKLKKHILFYKKNFFRDYK